MSTVSLDSTGKRKSFRRIIRRFAEKTSMQGVPYINNAKFWWTRLIWSVFTLAAVGAMIFHLYTLFITYYDFPKQTKITLGFDNLPFPAVTICNVNVIKRSRLKDIQGEVGEELRELLDLLRPERLAPPMTNEDENQNEAESTPHDGNSGAIDQTAPTGPPRNNGGKDTNRPSSKQQTKATTTPEPQRTSPGNHEQEASPKPSTPQAESQVTTRKTPPRTRSTTARRPRMTKRAPVVRKKRFIDALDEFNISRYEEQLEEDEDEHEFGRERDPQALIEKVFRRLYISIDRGTRDKVGHRIKDMLLSCSFNGRVCHPNNFTLHQTSQYGNCWTLSSEKLIARKSGPSGGLSLILYLENTDYITALTNGNGARLAISPRGALPFPADEGQYISAGFETNIGLRMVNITRLGGKYSHCESGNDFRNLYGTMYTRQACVNMCKLTTLLNECSCFDDEDEQLVLARNQLDQYQPCRSATERVCLNKVIKNYQMKMLTCNCANPCDELQFVKSYSNRQWPSDHYANILQQAVCERNPDRCNSIRKMTDKRTFSQNFLKLNVYYEDLNFEEVEEVPEYEDSQFAADVGGVLGLWIGLSVLSVCELLQLFVELGNYGAHRACGAGEKKNTRKKNEIRMQKMGTLMQDSPKTGPRRTPRHSPKVSPNNTPGSTPRISRRTDSAHNDRNPENRYHDQWEDISDMKNRNYLYP